MPGPIFRRAALLTFILVCTAVDSPPPARAAHGAPPKTMHGVYRYKVRGLTAGGGVITGMVGAQAFYAASVSRMIPGVLKILTGMAKVSKDPSTAEVMDFLRYGTPGVNFSLIPIAAGLDLEIEFTLEEVKKDEWQLKRGSYRWSSDANFSFSAGEGQIKERARAQGSGAIDPKLSSISWVTTGKRDSRRSELSGSVQVSGLGGGSTIIKNGPVTMAFYYRSDHVILEIILPGLAHVREKLGGGLWDRNFSFAKSGPVGRILSGPSGRVLRGRETYQDLLDSHVTEEWELWEGPCRATIKSPSKDKELLYDYEIPGRIFEKALAEVTPSFWEDELRWLLPEIEGSDLEPPRMEANGDSLQVIYTHLPEKNSAFGFREVVADFGDRAKAAGCKDPELTKVGYFFLRDGENHGGPPGLKSDSNPDKKTPNPNWFHYWMQTKANPGLPSHFVRYGGNDKYCATAYGYYFPGADHIVLCSDAHETGYNPFVPGFSPQGIDWTAQLILHERQHYADFREWWPPKGIPNPALDTDPVDPRTGKASPGDNIPDKLEPSLSPPPEVKERPGAKFDPKMQDSFGRGLNDEHYFPWAAALRWRMGSANKEDWACPGKQGRSKCREKPSL
jgi:hypothetical protein